MSFRDLEEDPLFVDDFSPENRLSSPDWLSNSPTHSPYHAKPDGKTEVHKIVNRYTVFPRKHVPYLVTYFKLFGSKIPASCNPIMFLLCLLQFPVFGA